MKLNFTSSKTTFITLVTLVVWSTQLVCQENKSIDSNIKLLEKFKKNVLNNELSSTHKCNTLII